MVDKITRSSTRGPKVAKPPSNTGKGGARAGAGRPVGSLSIKTKLKAADKKKALTKKIIEQPGIMPLEFMLKVMRNPRNSWAARQTAARDAAPYVHPRLASIVHKGDMKEPVAVVQMPDDTFRQLAKQVMNKV